MSRFLDAMRRAGFGTDEDGDRRRRDELSAARVEPDDLTPLADAIRRATVTPEEWRALGHLTPASHAVLGESISAALGSAARDDLRRRAERIQEEARRMSPRRPEPDPAPVAGHTLTETRGAAGVQVECECGRWDGWYNGPRSRRVVLGDHAAHVLAELSAGPIRVRSERADLPKELE